MAFDLLISASTQEKLEAVEVIIVAYPGYGNGTLDYISGVVLGIGSGDFHVHVSVGRSCTYASQQKKRDSSSL